MDLGGSLHLFFRGVRATQLAFQAPMPSITPLLMAFCCHQLEAAEALLQVGLGMIPRGKVGLIFLGLGRQAGVLTPSLEAAILLMVIGTSP